MKRLALLLSVAVTLTLGAVATAAPTPTRVAPYGHITLAAATATLVPGAPTSGRFGLAIQNLDSANIYCGGDSSVTNTTGWAIPPGGSFTVAATYFASSGAVKFYCYSVAGQTSPLDTRWIEVAQ